MTVDEGGVRFRLIATDEAGVPVDASERLLELIDEVAAELERKRKAEALAAGEAIKASADVLLGELLRAKDSE